MKNVRPFVCTIAIAFLGIFATAQTPTGTIQGLVADKTGAAISGATVTIVQTSTNEIRSAVTDASGRYNVPFIDPGNYNVTVNANGFRSAREENVLVQVTETRAVNFQLEVGAVNQTVQVSATIEALDVDTSNLGETIQSQTILQLPDNGRNIFDFALLVPGVNNGVAGTSEAGASTPHIGGSRNANNEQFIDGMTNILPENNVGNNESAYLPVEDSIQEENVMTSVPEAEYGRFSGGIISLITKSGSNELHGSFYEFVQNGALDAVPFSAPGAVNTNPKPDMHQYETGGTIGGPIFIPHVYDGHNKAFFFFDYEDYRQLAGSSNTYSIPNPAWFGGDFTSLFGSTTPSLYDPDSVYKVATGPKAGSYARCAFGSTVSVDGGSECAGEAGSINQIPASRISPVAAAALAYFPKVAAGAPTYNNFIQTGSVPTDYWHFDSRVDADVTKKWHSFLRYSELNQTGSAFNDYNNAASPGNYGGTYHTPDFSGSFNNTVTFTPTLLGEFRYGLSKQNYNRVPVGGSFDPAKLGFDSGFVTQAALEGEMFPNFQFNGNGSFSQLGPNGYEEYQEDPLAQSVNGSIVKIVGGHSLKFGGEFRSLRNNFYQWSYPSGEFTSDDSWTREFPQTADTTGFSVASFLLGLPSGGDITEDERSISTSNYYAFYGQDDWKLSPKVTFNFGLRWDMDTPHEELHNQLSFWNPIATSPLGSVSVASGVNCPACSSLLGAMTIVGTSGAQYGRRQVPFPKNDYGPRFGLAYNPTPKFVFRAGVGIIFQPSAFQAAGTTGSPGNEGFSTQTNFIPSLAGNQDSIPNASLYSPDPVIDSNTTTADPNPGEPFSGGYASPQGHQAACLASSACVQGIDLGNQLQNSYFDSYRTPYSIEWNGNVQFAMPWDMKLELGYLANKGVFLINGDPGKPYDQLSTGTMAQYGCTPGAPTGNCQLLNQVANPFYGLIGPGTVYTVASSSLTSSPTIAEAALLKHWPQYSSVSSFRKPGAASMYNAFTLRLDKNLAHGLTFTFSFTDGREYDNAASPVNYLGPASQTYADQYDPRAEWGIGAQNISYDIASSFLYRLPFGEGQPWLNHGGAVGDKFINGWQITGIEKWSTGEPILLSSVNNGTTTQVDQNPFGQRPAWTGQTAKLPSPSHKLWFNPNVFSMPASFAIGNAPRTLWDVNNPAYQDLDLAVAKNTMWGQSERYNVQFRLEMFNAFNHGSYGGPNASLTSGQFGVISSYQGSARQIQVAVKATF
jgi:Carboxypeptidase regulatory-like domain/TonB dependent receptor